jgi:hypothetical protein
MQESYFIKPTEQERLGSFYISPSSLVTYYKSPAEYYQRYVLNKKSEQTDAMLLGEAIHCAVLEPNEFDNRFCNANPTGNYLKTVEDITEAIRALNEKPTGKRKGDLITQLLSLDPNAKILEVYLTEIAESGRKALKPDEYQMCLDIKQKVSEHAWLSKALESGRSEVWLNSDYSKGVRLHGRMDFFSNNAKQPIILDLKTVRSAHPEEFQKQIWNDQMYIQAAMYCDMVKKATGKDPLFAWVTVEKKEPYVIEIYAADFGLIEAGRAVYYKTIDKLIDALNSNNFRGYTDGSVNNISLPSWAFSKLDYYADHE